MAKLGDLMPNDPNLVRDEFRSHKLNERGCGKRDDIAAAFSELLNNLESDIALKDPRGVGGRELALVRTHLEQASFYAVRAMALQPENQEPIKKS